MTLKGDRRPTSAVMFRSIYQFGLTFAVIAATVVPSFSRGEQDAEKIPTGALSGAAWRKDSENQQRYWVIKDAIRKAGEEWNRQHASKSPRVLVPSGFVAELRRAYVATLDKLWPSLTKEHGYTATEITGIREHFSDRIALGVALRSYLDEIALESAKPSTSNDEQKGPTSIFERMNEPSLGVRDAPDAIALPWGRHLGQAIFTLEPSRCTLHLTGTRLDEKFELEGGNYAFPLVEGKYTADTAAPNRTSVKREFQVTRGTKTEVKISLPVAVSIYPDAQEERPRSEPQCYREEEARQVDVLLTAYEGALGPGGVLRYDFRRFYAPWREGRIRLGGKLDLPFGEFSQRWRERYSDMPGMELLVPRRTRGEFSDGTGQRPNAAFHDPCSMSESIMPASREIRCTLPSTVRPSRQMWPVRLSNGRMPDGPMHPMTSIRSLAFQSMAGFMPRPMCGCSPTERSIRVLLAAVLL